MPVAALVLFIIAAALAAFGLLFVVTGRNGERGYWAQRDPAGDARAEATSLGVIAGHPWHYAAGEVRAPLRIIAIGVILWWIALVSAVVGIVVVLLG